jgi:hypothetical protein
VSDLDPAQAGNLDDLARCLRQLRLRVDSPSFRALEDRTKHATGLLPGTTISRIPLRRSTISEVLTAKTFPRKSFLLTFVEACGVDLEADQRWEQAWDRLAVSYQDVSPETYVHQLLRQIDDLRHQLVAAERRNSTTSAQVSNGNLIGQPVTDQSSPMASSEQGTGQDDRSRCVRVVLDVARAARSLPIGPQKASIQNHLALAISITDLSYAERIAKSITSEDALVAVLANIAQAMAGRSASLAAHAELVASSIAGEERKASALASVAQAMATADPERAERIARSITIEDMKALTLASVAQAMATADPERAERIARSITIEDRKAPTLASLAQAMATADPERAERIARSITIEDMKALTLAKLAQAAAAIDPVRATALANAAESTTSLIEDSYTKAEVLATIARALAATDLGRAERIAQSIRITSHRALALAGIARSRTITDQGHVDQLITDALEVAQSITWKQRRESTLAALAQEISAIDLVRAERIARVMTKGEKALALAAIVQTAAATDLSCARRLAKDAELAARSITREAEMASALARVAQAVASIDSTHADELISDVVEVMRSITKEHEKESVLVNVAQAIAALATHKFD